MVSGLVQSFSISTRAWQRREKIRVQEAVHFFPKGSQLGSDLSLKVTLEIGIAEVPIVIFSLQVKALHLREVCVRCLLNTQLWEHENTCWNVARL